MLLFIFVRSQAAKNGAGVYLGMPVPGRRCCVWGKEIDMTRSFMSNGTV